MAHSPLPSINNKRSVRSVSRSVSPSNTEYLAFSYSNLDPPFGLDFTKERMDICLSPTFDADSDEELSPSLCSFNSLQSRATTGYRPGGPKEARLKKVALLSKTKEVDNLYPVKVLNIKCDIKPDQLAKKFSTFGKVEDVYIPTDLKTQKNRDFAVIRYADKNAVQRVLPQSPTGASSVGSVSIDEEEFVVSPVSKQKTFYTKGTGYLGITNEAFDDGTRPLTAKPPPPQNVTLSSCLARSGAPWGSVRELKVLAPRGSIPALEKYAIKLTNLPNRLSPEELAEYFSQYGKIVDVSCPKTLLVTERPREPNVGVAFVRFDDKRDLDVALADLTASKISFDGQVIKGEMLRPGCWPTNQTRRYY